MKKLFIASLALASLFYGCSKSKPDVNPTQTNGVTTYVGNGTPGLVNGSGTGAELNEPVDLAVDASGNLYISDEGNNVIRKVAPGGAVTTFAGDGTAGYKDGAGTAAEFNGPEGIVIDETGNVYVADSQNKVIRKITSSGVVSTYAGSGTSGYLDGPGTTAEFATPNGLAIDKSRNIYVADVSNNVIRKISSGGTVSTYAGTGAAGSANGAASSASFHFPSGVTVDPSGNLFVVETANGDVREISTGGQVTTFATGLLGPIRVTIDGASSLYASCGDNTIQKIDNTGKVSTYAGSGSPGYSDGSLLLSQFTEPAGLIANTQGVVIVADYGNNRIRVLTP
jgi:sugar lactone lactonase YvrE